MKFAAISIFFGALIITGITIFCSPLCDIPLKVIDSFIAKYPEVKSVNWVNKGNQLEAEFKLNNKWMIVIFDSKGNILK